MTRPLYLPLHRVTLVDEVEQAEMEMIRNTPLIPHEEALRRDFSDTECSDFGGLAEPRPNIVKRAFDAIAPDDARLLGQLDAETRAQVQCNRDALKSLIWPAVIAFCVACIYIKVSA